MPRIPGTSREQVPRPHPFPHCPVALPRSDCPVRLPCPIALPGEFDMRVKECQATGGQGPLIQITDEIGCVLRPKMFSKFLKVSAVSSRRGQFHRVAGNFIPSRAIFAFFSKIFFSPFSTLFLANDTVRHPTLVQLSSRSHPTVIPRTRGAAFPPQRREEQ